MKRKFLGLFVIVLAIISVFCFAACDTTPDNGQVAVTDITLNETEITLEVGDIKTLVATVLPDNATDKTVIWASSDDSVATVENGIVTAVKEGEVTIIAVAGSKITTCEVAITVAEEIAVDSISLNKTSLILETGETETLTATVLPDEAKGATVAWKSSDNSVATVEDGKITPINNGTATITALSGGKSATCKVAVINVTSLKELRCRAVEYEGRRVWAKGVITAQYNNTVFIEEYDDETECYFGMAVYYGYATNVLQQLKIGNRVRVSGYLSEYQGTYQMAGITYNRLNPDDPNNTVVLSEGHERPFTETNAADITSGKLDINLDGETVTLDYGEAVTATTVTVSNLKVLRVTTISNSGGALKLECQAEDGTTIIVRTTVLNDEDGTVITADRYEGKTITVKGVVENDTVYDSFDEKDINTYCVRCYLADHITVL